ncbi:MAG: protein-tyrosine-phosphatase [Lewinellaceae bacterium]|jgi:protein-tyrosine-phosphatase|nr:protein-tyrosine-phosphatase [Saprospiraceae bacterium]MCB9341745.1 protein-tyrosine-phosphatase [Lewinellaceae bacterium]
MGKPKFYEKLMAYCSTLEGEVDQIPEARKEQLDELGDFIYEKKKAGGKPSITVICTHNSRRSHMGQLWLEAAAGYYGIDDLLTASGGTEATAFNPRAVTALKKAGFKFDKNGSSDNPVYEASLGADYPHILMFSKKYDHRNNPTSGFAAVMVCSEADASCPFVPGADARFSIPYEDPKNFDGTPSEEIAYDERCRQIAREMFYAVKHAKNRLVVGMEKAKAPSANN